MKISSEMFLEAVNSSSHDVVAVGGDINPGNLINAYKNGVFPWYNEGEEVHWWCPEERFVLFPEEIKISKSMKRVFETCTWEFTINKDFLGVITNCQKIHRPSQDGTWINSEIINAFSELHKTGLVKSFEVWENNLLIGGFYGIEIGNVFCGESMFSLKPNASKAAFIKFAKDCNYQIIDCQIHTSHLESLGAKIISKSEFLNYIYSSND